MKGVPKKVTAKQLFIVMIIVNTLYSYADPITQEKLNNPMRYIKMFQEEVKNPASKSVKTISENITKEIQKISESNDEIKNYEKAKVIEVIDGDTMIVDINQERFKVRFTGVNTPESTGKYAKNPQPYGKEASDFTKKHLTGKTVYLEKDVGNTDKYNRLLRYVWLEKPDPKKVETAMFNAVLLSNGMGSVMTIQPNIKYTDLFVQLERKARESKTGLWGKK